MNVGVLNQVPSGDNLSEEIKRVLLSEKYESLRILMAYISWDGISLIHKELEKFYDSNNKVEMIIGLSDGISDPSTLSYFLHRFPISNIWAFHARNINYIFHPKVYFFENKNEILIYIGSNNFTLGGLFLNSECCMKLEVQKKKNLVLCDEINAIWNTYKNPCSPFGAGNIKKLNHSIINIYKKSRRNSFKKYTRVRKSPLDNLFSNIVLPSPPVARMKRSFKKPKRLPLKKGITLLLEVLKETGADGTQVQIPRDVVKNYFNLDTSGHQTIELQFVGNNVRPAVVCHFGNNTHRISFPEVASCSRPLLMKFIKTQNGFYSVEIIRGRQYSKLLKACTEQTRYGAKKWGIL